MAVPKFLTKLFGNQSSRTPLERLAEVIGINNDKPLNDPVSTEMAVTTLLKCQKCFLQPTDDHKIELACFVRAYSQANAIHFEDSAGRIYDLIAQYGGLDQEVGLNNQRDAFVNMAKDGAATGSDRYSNLIYKKDAFSQLTH